MVDYYSVNRLNNSRLGYFKTNPFYYYNRVILNKRDDEDLDNKSLENGKLIHLYIESPYYFVISDVQKVDGMMGKFIESKAQDKSDEDALKDSGFNEKYYSTALKNFTKEENQAYLQHLKLNSSKFCLTTSQNKTICNCITSIHSNQLVYNYLLGNELFCDYFNELGDEEVECKSRIDRLVIDHTEKIIKIIDAKTTSGSCIGDMIKINDTGHIGADYYTTGFFRNFLKYDMYRQASFYKEAVLWALNNRADFKDLKLWTYQIKFYFVPIETTYQNECCVYEISNTILEYGHKEIKELITQLLWCKNNNIWKREKLWNHIQII